VSPQVTIVIPTLNQGHFLEDALKSVFQQEVRSEVFVCDGGSTDNTLDVIKKWEPRLRGWRSGPDGGQAEAINEGMKEGRAPFVCWLNSDDWFLPGGLSYLVRGLEQFSESPAVYARAWNLNPETGRRTSVWTEPFSARRLSRRCIISQPATLIRRSSWEDIGGVDTTLNLAMDYDLWWRLFKKKGELIFLDEYVAVNRDHSKTKTRNLRADHYREAIEVVRKHYGRVPLKWWLAQPYAVWYKSLKQKYLTE